MKNDVSIGVIGLGYVGLPLALAFSQKFPGTIGFDIDEQRVALLKQGIDVTHEGLEAELKKASLTVTINPDDLRSCNFFVIGVPTPVDENRNPDLGPLIHACQTVAMVMKPDSIIVFESTVYPGVTDDICGPLIERVSGLVRGKDFRLGYSPERINPGDKSHTLSKVVKVVSGEDAETLDRVATVYQAIIEAGIHRAPSIKVAEAAKVIENTQRDLNIALMNELSLIFDRMGIATKDVLDAAGTKWNFLRFTPGLVGGHCIGVDPYYLTTKAQQLGYHPQVILAGRRINDGMGHYVGQRVVKLMVNAAIPIKGARVGILGVTFKENVSDTRNSRVFDIIKELQDFGITVLVHDPLASPEATQHEYGVKGDSLEEFSGLDALVLAVPHTSYLQIPIVKLAAMLRDNGVLVDIKSVLPRESLPKSLTYWSL